MMRSSITRRFIGFTALFTLFCASWPLAAQAPSATARFEPPVISSGQAGSYTVTLENVNQIPPIPAPDVGGLVFDDAPSVSRRQSWINGVSSQELSLSWRFAAQREGTFTVPARNLEVGGESIQVPAARIRVVPMSEREQGLFSLEWELPEKTYYVGEAIPASLKVYLREGLDVRIPALPEKEGDGFLQTPFTDEVFRTRETVDGIDYTVYVWSLVLTPIRAGSLDLEASLPVVYADPLQSRFSTDAFGFRRVREQQRRLSTGKQSFRIAPLPTRDRPDGFNGALGKFETNAELGRPTVQEGEPVTLTMQLSGTGNFDRIPAPIVEDTEAWRVYPPKVSFSADGELGLTGTKTFEYLLIPRSTDTDRTPRITFAAFDPYEETYVGLSAEPLPVSVTPAPVSDQAPTAYGGRDPSDERAPAGAIWRSNRADLGTLRPAIRPLFLAPGFWIAQGGVALAFLLVFAWQKRQHRLVNDESYARRVVGSRSVRQWSRAAGEAAAREDAEGFYSSAQRALQESVGRRFPRSRKAGSLTLAEVEETLRAANVSESCRTSVRKIFQTGDALKYARSSFSQEQLKTDADRLMEILRELQKQLS